MCHCMYHTHKRNLIQLFEEIWAIKGEFSLALTASVWLHTLAEQLLSVFFIISTVPAKRFVA